MPRLAFALCVIGIFSLFVVRSGVQLRRTGSTGFKGFHGRIGSLPWIAGVATTLGFLLAPLGPLAALLRWPGGGILFENAALHLVGLLVASVGITGALAAQFSMGSSWRIGVDESETTELVTHGLFGWIRNPIFSFIGLTLVGLALAVPNLLALPAMFLTALGIEIQVRVVEEPYLIEKHGEAYRRYAGRVGRFVPGLGRSRTTNDRAPQGAVRS